MMKRTATLSLALFALAACSGSTNTTDGGSGTSGGGSSSGGSSSSGGGSSGTAGVINVTLASVGVHPAALAALSALGLTPPSLSAGYSVKLQAVTLKAGSPSISGLGTVALDGTNDTGPITFPSVNVSGGVASLGLISAVVADPLPDGGTPVAPAPPTCAQLAAPHPTGFTDYFVTAAAQVYFGTPTTDITNGVAFALPESYVALLDCAAGIDPASASDLVATGFALLYASQDAAAGGAALGGVNFSNGQGNFFYFPAGYAAGSATATGPTSANGVATITGITGLGTVGASDAAAGTFKSRDLATESGSCYQVFYAPGT